MLICTVFGVDCALKSSNCYNGPHYTSFGSICSCRIPGTIAMTFDDGPSKYTKEISQKLFEHNMRATFFAVGKRINRNTRGILDGMLKLNHQIASHTYSHVDLTTLSDGEIRDDMEKFERNFDDQKLFSKSIVPKYIRVPFSRMNANIYTILSMMNYTIIDWTLDGHDTDGGNVIVEYQKNLGGANASEIKFDGISIITIQHDTTNMTIGTIDRLLDWFSKIFIKNGVRFVTISECLGDDEPYKIFNSFTNSIKNSCMILVMIEIFLFRNE